MKTPDLLIKTAKVNSKYIHPGLKICLVVYAYYQRSLNIFLSKNECGQWELPVGFMYSNEDISVSTKRIIKEYTGIEPSYLQQFYVFTDIPTQQEDSIDNSIKERYIRVGYNVFIKFSEMQYSITDNPQLNFIAVDKLLGLGKLNLKVINKSLAYIKYHLNFNSILKILLPSQFTISELRVIHEIIFNRKIDRRNFQRKMLNSEIIIRLNEPKKNLDIKTTHLFRFNCQI